jgi:L-lactate permease
LPITDPGLHPDGRELAPLARHFYPAFHILSLFQQTALSPPSIPFSNALVNFNMNLFFTRGYQQVGQEDSSEKSSRSSTEVRLSRSSMPTHWATIFRWLPWMLVSILIITNWYAWVVTKSAQFPGSAFCELPASICTPVPLLMFDEAPASSAIKYKDIVFQAGIDSDTSLYQGQPSQELDLEWEELHKCKSTCAKTTSLY